MLLVAGGTVWFCGDDGETLLEPPGPETPAQPLPSGPSNLAQPAASDGVAPALLEPAPRGLDAAVELKPEPDAGRWQPNAEEQRAAAALLRRWSQALEELSRWHKHQRALDATRRQKPPADAGALGAAPVTCEAGTSTLRFELDPVDLIIAVDTSGSMFHLLPKLERWLVTQVDPLARSHDVQLIVLLDPLPLEMLRSGKPRPSAFDAGLVHPIEIQSHDILEVVLDSKNAWLPKLRPDSRKHLLLITDDDPDPALPARFTERLARELVGVKLQLHGLLGFQAIADQPLLGHGAPPVNNSCAVAPGLAYQQLIIETRGARGSLCDSAAWQSMAQALLPRRDAPKTCAIPLPPGAIVKQVHVRGQKLTPAFDRFNCEQEAGHYQRQLDRLELCPPVCEALSKSGGTLSAEVELVCQPP